ncbi:MAG TPA: ATP-binding cassette domain-containing protein [Ktedonobacteraceae bacterium]|jgi:molybdate transport system ATP-binding protein|nr:ATP-binding cassette domain-containing protein [Ktedonobacteraceae bacterium]
MLKVNLQHRLGNFRLSVDFQVPLNFTVLFGFSGAGKSLTLRGLAGLLHPERGSISIAGEVLFDSASGVDLPPQERRVGYVPQHYALFPHLNVVGNILFALPHYIHWPGSRKIDAAHKARLDELLAALELEGLERRYPATLSGGQQQRVALARALMARPRLLLLDEPFNALDVSVRERLRDTLRQFQRHFAIPIVLVTHDHTEVQQLADQVVVLQQGQVAQVGSVQEIFLSPATSTVARLAGQDNHFSAYLAAPPQDQLNAPAKALLLNLPQANALAQIEQPAPTGRSYDGRLLAPTADSSASLLTPITSTELAERVSITPAAWLPLPPSMVSFPASTSLITGCIRNDEVQVHRWSGSNTPPAWTERGSIQWPAELLEAQVQGPSMRLLVRPQWMSQSSIRDMAESANLKIYLSRAQWREVAVMPGELLLLEIGPEAIHLFTQ